MTQRAPTTAPGVRPLFARLAAALVAVLVVFDVLVVGVITVGLALSLIGAVLP